MKMNDKKKRNFIIAGGVVAIVVLTVVIGGKFHKPAQDADIAAAVLSETKAETEAVPNTEIEKVESTGATATAASHTVDKETETLPPQAEQMEQKIQTEVTKPAEPSMDQKINPKQKPNGETVVETEPVNHEDVVASTAAPVVEEVQETEAAESSSSNETQGGETSAGGIYVPGFGWVEGAGDSYGVTAEDIYENGNKIGIMN